MSNLCSEIIKSLAAASLVPEYAVSGHLRHRRGSILAEIAPSNVYPGVDGEYLIGANQTRCSRGCVRQ